MSLFDSFMNGVTLGTASLIVDRLAFSTFGRGSFCFNPWGASLMTDFCGDSYAQYMTRPRLNYSMPFFGGTCSFNYSQLQTPVQRYNYDFINLDYFCNSKLTSCGTYNTQFNSNNWLSAPSYADYFNRNALNTPIQFQSSITPLPQSQIQTPGLAAVGDKSKKWYEYTDAELRQIYGNYTRDITQPYNGTADKLNKYLQGKGVLEGKGQAFIDAQQKYGISAVVLMAICMLESGRGTSDLAKNKNNVGGVRIKGSHEFKSFDRVEDCIDYMGSFLKSGYVNNSTRSLTKLYEVNARYCPISDTTDKKGNNHNWASSVNQIAGEIETAIA